MALAARTQADPRTACPVCGGPIHPIAGKCKHCKTDLVKLRRQQQAASGTPAPTRLPYGGAVNARPPTAPLAPVPMHAASSGPIHAARSAQAPTGAPVIITAPIAANDPYVASLPPIRRGAWSRSWPIVVAVIAAAAIVVSVILLLTGNDDHKPSTQKITAPPAPDRMDTNPLPADPDPWKGATPPSGGSGNTFPTQPSPPTPPASPPSPSPTAATVPPVEKWQSGMLSAACQRLTSCGTLDSSVKQVCDDLTRAASAVNDTDTRDRVARGECTYDQDKAAACLGAIQHIPCTQGQTDLGALSQTIVGIAECTDVVSCH